MMQGLTAARLSGRQVRLLRQFVTRVTNCRHENLKSFFIQAQQIAFWF